MSNYFEIAAINEFGGNTSSLVSSRLLEVKDCVLYHNLSIFYRLSEGIPSLFQHSKPKNSWLFVRWLIDFTEAEALLNFRNKIYRQLNKSMTCTTLKTYLIIKTRQKTTTLINAILFQM